MKFRQYIPIVLFSLIVLAPLIAPLLEPGTLHKFDMLLHLERIVAFQRSLAEGVIPPTWSTYLSWGFGSPVLIYNWSLPYYVASAALWLGSTLVDSYKWLTGLSYILAYIWMFLFITTVTKSKLAALVGAAWYVWAPYWFNINQLRGAIGEEFALAFWPGVFWATTVIYRKKYSLGFLAGVLLWGSLIWSHPAMFGMIVPLWVMFVLTGWIFTRDRRALLLSLGAMLFGLGLLSYSWFPIIFERGFLGYGTHEMIYPDNFVRWEQLLAQPDFMEFGLERGPTRYLVFYSIGWPLITVGLLTAIARLGSLRNKLTAGHFYQLLFLGMGMLAVFLLRPASAVLWANLPLLAPTMVYPQRFLALVAFCGSVLAALLIANLNRRQAKIVAFIFIVWIVVIDFPFLTLNKNRETDITIARLNSPVLTTTDVWGEFSPKWIPSDFAQNWLTYAAQPLITVTPKTNQIPSCRQTSTSVSCRIDTTVPSQIRFRQFYFPGWAAEADNIAVPVQKAADGTIQLILTNPTTTAAIFFRGTPLANEAKLLSLLSIGVYLYLLGKTLYTRLRSRKQI